MKVPVQIIVLGKKVRVEYVSELPEGNSGELVCGERLIRISKSRHKTEREVFSTLYHELTHLAFELTGHSAEWTDAQEEPLTYALESALADILVLNPAAPIRWRHIDFD